MIDLYSDMSKTKCIIVLHKSGEPSHYRGLQYLADQNGLRVSYREFSVLSKTVKAILKLDWSKFHKQLLNFGTLLSLYFSKNKTIVLGIAPYDKKLRFLLRVLKNHKVSYHTSWPIWDGTSYPKKKGVNKHVMEFWRSFLEDQVLQIFAVSNTAKNSLESNYQLKAPVFVVGHSYNDEIFNDNNKEKKYKACYAGRLIEEKGITEIIDWCKINKSVPFAVMGAGRLENEVKNASKYSSITYFDKTSSLEKVSNLFQESEYLILFSKKTEKWQELFGMVIIEAMACGCIPVATDHIGPMELIEHKINGYIFTESNFMNGLNEVLANRPTAQMVHQAKTKAAEFCLQEIAKRWEPIL